MTAAEAFAMPVTLLWLTVRTMPMTALVALREEMEATEMWGNLEDFRRYEIIGEAMRGQIVS